MFYKSLLISATVVSFISCSNAFARMCEGEIIHNAQINDVIEFKYKVKVNAVCQRVMRKAGYQFIGIEFTQYPKGIMSILTKDYEFAFSFKKTGTYVVKYRVHLRDRYGKEGFTNYIMNTVVVEKKWK